MRRLRCVVVVGLALSGLMGLASCSPTPQARDTTVPVILSDLSTYDPSNVKCWTVGDSTLSGDHYITPVAALIPHMYNFARGGSTLLPYFGVANLIRPQVLEAVAAFGFPSCVVIHGGAADTHGDLYGIPPSNGEGYTMDDYAAEIEYLTGLFESNGTRVYWLNPVPPAPPYAIEDPPREAFRQLFQELLPDQVIDCNASIDGNGDGLMDAELAYGYFHPRVPASLTDWNHWSTVGAVRFAGCLHEALLDRGELT